MSTKVTTVESDKKDKDEKSDSDILNQFVTDEFERRFDQLEGKLRSETSEEKVKDAFQKLMPAFQARNALGERPEREKTTYLTDYEFLKSCYQSLTKTRDEGFCLVTGPEMKEGVYTLTRRVEPELKRQGPAGAEPDMSSLNKLLERIDEDFGEHLSGYFHSHPGRGRGATAPSSIDLTTQERLERGGYPVIGCIFSRDGYLRFYSKDRDFDLEVSGNGGEQIEQRSFRLE